MNFVKASGKNGKYGNYGRNGNISVYPIIPILPILPSLPIHLAVDLGNVVGDVGKKVGVDHSFK